MKKLICILNVLTLVLLTGCPGQPPANAPPIADAGPDQDVNGSDDVMLDGTGSSDPENGVLTFLWTQSAGPTTGLQDASSPEPTFRAPNVTATLRYTLAVTDDADQTTTDFVSIRITAVDNQRPFASAGSNQVVRGAELVQLDGSGSGDLDGDTLTYSWVQRSGESITLDDATSESPTFTAPNTDTELEFELTVDDGNDNTDSDTVIVTVDREATLLFVANVVGNSVLRFSEPGALDGNEEPDAFIEGAGAALDGPTGLLVSRANAMIVANRNTSSLNLYLSSGLSGGSDLPSFVVRGNATQLDQPASMAYDADADLVYVSDIGATSDILRFPGPTSVVFNGNLPPDGVIASTSLSLPAGIQLDGAGNLYVANTGAVNVLVFDDASTIDGSVTPDRTITSTSFSDPVDILVDTESDTLYVVDSTGSVFRVTSASTQSGAVTPTSTLTIPGASLLTGLAVSLDDTGFLLDAETNSIYVFDDFSTRSGTQAPDRTISGDDTELSRPVGLFLVDD